MGAAEEDADEDEAIVFMLGYIALLMLLLLPVFVVLVPVGGIMPDWLDMEEVEEDMGG